MKSWVEISGASLAENLRAVQTVAAEGAGTGVEVLAVVKANAYGHDAALVAPVLTAAGAHWLGVSDVEEGARVRQALGPGTTRILVMSGMEPDDAPALIAHGLTPVLWTVDHVAEVERAARAAGQPASVHLEIDTGMARQGVAPGGELAATLERLAASRWVNCEGVMSHLVSAEVAETAEAALPEHTRSAGMTHLQRARFSAALRQVTATGVRPALVHLGNSSAVDEGITMGWIAEESRRLGARPMVRTGFALYGYCLPIENSRAAQASGQAAHRSGLLAPRLRPALVWKTRVIGLREIAAGDTVGYGATFTAVKPTRVALLPVGYSDGFRREASSSVGAGWVMLAGQRAPVVGRVSMNLTTVDVTSIPEAVPGSEAVLLGEGVTAADHAAWSGTIGYEILCGIRARCELRP